MLRNMKYQRPPVCRHGVSALGMIQRRGNVCFIDDFTAVVKELGVFNPVGQPFGNQILKRIGEQMEVEPFSVCALGIEAALRRFELRLRQGTAVD